MSGPPLGKGRLFQRGIRLTGSVHTHDELVGIRNGILVAGNAHSPHFELTPLQTRVSEAIRGEILLAAFRWYDFLDPVLNMGRYRKFQHTVEAGVKLLAELQVPYDQKAIWSHARNWIRGRLGYLHWLGPRLKHTEYKVFCTESCFKIYHVAGLNVAGLAGDQPLPAPIHAERLYAKGMLVPVADWGLVRHLKKDEVS